MLWRERHHIKMTMGKIIYCSDLVLRIDESEDVTNITEWLMESTDYRPLNPEGCVIRQEMTTMGKLTVILVVWIALVVLTTFYCYFCEQRLFPANKAKRLAESQYADEGGKDDSVTTGHLSENMATALPKPRIKSRKESLASTCSCNSVATSSITGSVGPYRRF